MALFLPQELVWELLVRLPVKELVRAQCVCRSWRDAIRDPCFIQRHSQLAGAPEADKNSSDTLLFAQSQDGTLLLAWQNAFAVSQPFSCRTCPDGILVGAAGGLLCYKTRLEDIVERQINFVVWNPVTSELLRIPTLNIRPFHGPIRLNQVTMVVQQGRLHLLVVHLYSCMFVYDCFISKEAMEKRISSSGSRIYPLPNLWMELHLQYYTTTAIAQMRLGSSKLACVQHTDDIVVDLDDFSIKVAVRRSLPEAEWSHCRLFEGSASLCSISNELRVIRGFGDRFIVCTLTFIETQDEGLVSTHQPLFRFRTSTTIPSPSFSLRSMSVARLPDKLLILFTYTGLDKHEFKKWVEGYMVDIVQHNSGRLSEAVRIPDISPFPLSLHCFRPSLKDLPGSLLQEIHFNWGMVQFPDEIELLHKREELELLTSPDHVYRLGQLDMDTRSTWWEHLSNYLLRFSLFSRCHE